MDLVLDSDVASGLFSPMPDNSTRKRPGSGGRSADEKKEGGVSKKVGRAMMLKGNSHLGTLGKRKGKRIVNVLGKSNYLLDSGSTYHVQQLAKNLPGVCMCASQDDYYIYTANGNRLHVSHYSNVDSIGESVVCQVDTR
jgi:hypothetical protein